MLFAISLLAALASARVICRADLSTNDGLEITRIFLSSAQPDNTTLQFNVHNPDPLSNASTTCSGSWPPTETFPNDYQLCQNGNFTWRLDEYTAIDSFTIGLTHRFKDPSIGDPPYDSLRVFAKALVNDTILIVSANRTSAMQQNGTVLAAPIYAVIA